MPGVRLKTGAGVGGPNENLGTDDVDDSGGTAVDEDEDEDIPENEKRGAVGFELSDVTANETVGGTGASALVAAGAEPKVAGKGEELEEAPKIGT